MPTEKYTKDSAENISSNLTIRNKEVFKVKKWILTHRINTRKKILSNQFSFFNMVTILPFIFGFFQFLNSKATLENQNFFEKNLPVISELKPKYKYETLQYIIKSNTSLNLKQKFFLLGQPKFIAKVKKPTFLINKNTISYNFYLLGSGNFISTKDSIDRTLDGLPSYIEGLKENQIDERPFLLEIKKKESKQQKKLNLHKSNFLNSTKITKKSFPKLQLIKNLNSQIQSCNDISTFLENPDPFLSNRIEFYKNLNLLNSEFQNNFINKNFSLDYSENQEKTNSEFINLEKFLTTNVSNDEDALIEKVLEKLEKDKISSEFQSSRLMSGYNYPDITTTQLSWFYKQNNLFGLFTKKTPFFVEKNKQKINFPVITTTKYFLNIQELPSVLVETKKLLLKTPDKKKILYDGPSIVLDSDRVFDWKTHGEKNFRSWFNSYISPLNPFTQTQDNFFGIYDSPNFSSTEAYSISEDFKKNSLLEESFFSTHNRWELGRNPLESFFNPFTSSLHLPTSVENINKLFIRGINVQFANDEKIITSEQFLPIIQLEHPHFTSYPQQLSKFNSYSPLFDLGITAKPDYSFSTNSFTNKFFTTKYTSGRYSKTASIFSKYSRSIGSGIDNWEPLTSESWLILAQISFAFFIFQVLKSLKDNYGRELLGYLLDLVSSLGFLDDSLKQEIEILMGQRAKGFRIVLKNQKNFTDIVGIEKFLPEIYEILLFLRNSGRNFLLSKALPRGILLIGPPGTGKTLLVQALAGEAQVPIIVLSGSSLIEPGESGSVKLEMVFQEARQISPCIVFIDEIDTLGQKRVGIVHNPMDDEEIVDLVTSTEKKSSLSNDNLIKDVISENSQEEGSSYNKQQLGLLTRLLIELDGMQGRDGVIVIGATNRPDALDPALLRPGRFDQIMHIGLPHEEKRVEILKFYGQNLGYKTGIPWTYLANRTIGFSAADLATLMNESAIKAILEKSVHTVETIEHGINRLTTSENEKYNILKRKLKTSNDIQDISTDKLTSKLSSCDSNIKNISVNSKFYILRLAYYQAGKILISYLLENHPKIVVASLWPRRPSIRSIEITNNLQNSVFKFAKINEVNDRLVGCYAGKAAEFLFLENFSSLRSYQKSTLGLEDLIFAQKLIRLIIEKPLLYKKTLFQKNIYLNQNQNHKAFQLFPEKIEFYEDFLQKIQKPPIKEATERETSSLKTKKIDLEKITGQTYYSIPWWQEETSNTLRFTEKNFSNWTRIYLYNPELNERNVEWLPPDEFYHINSGLKNIKTAFSNIKRHSKQKISKTETNPPEFPIYPPQKVNFTWNNVSKITQDYKFHSLALQSFNKCLVLLNKNRELLDSIVSQLIYKEILRQPEIEELFKDFGLTLEENSNLLPQENLSFEINKKEKEIQILEPAWGSNSRKPFPRWINFAEF